MECLKCKKGELRVMESVDLGPNQYMVVCDSCFFCFGINKGYLYGSEKLEIKTNEELTRVGKKAFNDLNITKEFIQVFIKGLPTVEDVKKS